MIKSTNNSRRRRRWYLGRGRLALPYVASLTLIEAAAAAIYVQEVVPPLVDIVLLNCAILLALSLVSIFFIAFSSNRDLPVTFACQTILYIFAAYMLVVILLHSFYSLNLTAFSSLTTVLIGTMLSIRVAKFHGDKALWIGEDPERKNALGDGIVNLADAQIPDDYDLFVVDRTTDRAKVSAVTNAYALEHEIITFSNFYEYRYGRVYLPDFDVGSLSHSVNQRIYIGVKRIMDIFTCLLFSPVILLACGFSALYILIVSGRPIFFRQERIGFGGVPFRILKFRTMGEMPEELATTTTQKGDSRIIKGGHFLRRFRLDEFPQFLHVLTGQMSLIGPRPEWTVLVERYTPLIPKYSYRHLVRPGLSGWAQVKMGYASDVEETARKISYDLYYVKYISLELDLRILIKTIRALMWNSGAR